MLKKVLKNLYLHTEEFISVVFITIAGHSPLCI